MLVDVGVVQGRRLAPQRHQVVQRIEHLHALGIRTHVAGNDPALGYHLDALDISLHGNRRESVRTRHAVGVALETHGLVLVHLGRLGHTRVKGSWRQRQSRGTLTLETLADGLLLAGLSAFAVTEAASTQLGIELGQVTDRGEWRGPVTLQELHAPFDTRLLLGLTHQAEQRLKIVVAGQSRVTRVQLTAPPFQQVRDHRLGIVPPEFARHTPEEREGFHQPMQNRLGTLGRQRQSEGTIGVSPGHHQHRDLPPSLRKLGINVAEVGFQALAGIVVQRNEGLAVLPLARPHVKPDAFVATRVAMFLSQPPPELAGRVPLFARRLFIVRHELIDDWLERLEN